MSKKSEPPFDFTQLFVPDRFFELCRHGYFEKKHKRALIDAIVYALLHELEVPGWAREALIRGYLAEPKSWDDVFGTPFPKGAKIESLRRLNRKTESFPPRPGIARARAFNRERVV
jgi:hypothetical protein